MDTLFFEKGNSTEKGFPEGKLVGKIHLKRERNSLLIKGAKRLFQEKFGKLFCQICNFDFEEIYGELGRNFIEGHHTIPVSTMTFDYETKVEEIAMVCSNCHKMLHRRRPWLSMDKLKNLLKK
jgi:predicted HNH restriction endonuclease